MDITVRRQTEYGVSRWSGGETTELFIYPEGATYGKRDFLFRLSFATVARGQSHFTLLPGIHRILMVLEGEVRLEWQNRSPVTLHPADTCGFPGDWDTVSCGGCRVRIGRQETALAEGDSLLCISHGGDAAPEEVLEGVSEGDTAMYVSGEEEGRAVVVNIRREDDPYG